MEFDGQSAALGPASIENFGHSESSGVFLEEACSYEPGSLADGSSARIIFHQLSPNAAWRKPARVLSLRTMGGKAILKTQGSSCGARSLRTQCHWPCVSPCSPVAASNQRGAAGKEVWARTSAFITLREHRHLFGAVSLRP